LPDMELLGKDGTFSDIGMTNQPALSDGTASPHTLLVSTKV